MNRKCVIDIETEGLEPWKDRIICIGVRDTDNPKTIVFFDEDEKAVLEGFVKYYLKKGFNEVIGFNVNFDIRFIFAKCLKYEIPAPGLFNSTFTDVMDNVRSVKRIYSYNKPGKLEQWLQFLFERREFTRIIQYNKQDVDMTYELWKRIRMVLCQK